MADVSHLDPAGETARITEFIQDTFTHAGKSTAIIALSGGLDSATSLMLAALALGPEHVVTLHLPAKNSAPIHTEYAHLAAQTAGLPDANFLTIPIGAIIQKSWRIIKRAAGESFYEASAANARTSAAKKMSQGENRVNRLRLANLAARIRMTITFDQAKQHNALVIGTENLSEHLLGYYTRFGDEASDLEPIRHLYKTQVKELATHLKIPQVIIDQPPSAGLWHGQTDAQELGFTYQEADPLLDQISQGKTPAPSAIADTVTNQVQKNAFKRAVPYHL